jgi:alpha-beta hydrolase superfamily lysophospholipase
LCSCTTPVNQYNNLATDFAFVQSKVETELFRHVYFSNRAVDDMNSHQALHIYLEGDGTPWINGKWVATDPTPRKAVMLELMRLDSSPAILLGRPCYHLKTEDQNCNVDDWTMGRYSTKVVASMVEAINTLQQRLGFSEVVLFGHSGGGVIALLIADSLEKETTRASTVVTLAANIDTDAWTDSHGYLPLERSLNPALLPALPSSTQVLHLFAENDKVVDAKLFEKYLSSRPSVRSIVYQGFDHSCCWATVWPHILEKIQPL